MTASDLVDLATEGHWPHCPATLVSDRVEPSPLDGR